MRHQALQHILCTAVQIHIHVDKGYLLLMRAAGVDPEEVVQSLVEESGDQAHCRASRWDDPWQSTRLRQKKPTNACHYMQCTCDVV